MEGMGMEAFAVAPFFWSGRVHGKQRNTHLESCSIGSWRSRRGLPFVSLGLLPSEQVALFLVSCRYGVLPWFLGEGLSKRVGVGGIEEMIFVSFSHASGSVSPTSTWLSCFDAASQIFMADRSLSVGVCKPPFDHSCEGQLPENLVVRAVVRLILKDFSDLFFR